MVGEDPREGHLNGELNTHPHGKLQIELPEPQLGEVATLSKSGYNDKSNGTLDLEQQMITNLIAIYNCANNV